MSSNLRGGVVLVGLVASALALAIAPSLMPSSYSWVSHTTSESAAQGVPGAWLARVGFVVFGVAVVVVAFLMHHRWGSWGAGLHAAFGTFMIAAGIFSARPWDPLLPFSRVEDLLHSVAATAMGFAFAIGVAVVALQQWKRGGSWRLIDLTAVAASIVLPLAMVGVADLAGVLQRAMFLVAFVWYGLEAYGTRSSDSRGDEPPAPR